jgi:cytoskeletal protein RodZ
MFDKFAEELKTLRETKDLTLQQVAVKTKIDYKFLEAMESGDFEFLPELYVKAFLREYLRILGS